MKTTTLTAIFSFLLCCFISAQQEKGITGYNNWLNPWTEFKPSQTEYGKPTQILQGNITSDTKLLKRDIYLLLGDVFVTDSTTLTIEAGTVIIGDFQTKGSLTISNGSKIIAEGTATDPIIFTSSRSRKKPGDWGGIFLLGDAPTNKYGLEASLKFGLRPANFEDISYGGSNPASNSGIMKYVRIEFAGKRTKGYGYFNGLTLAGVGFETQLENIMVSYCEGNGFGVLGGNLIITNAVSHKSHINDFDVNYGAQLKLINSIAVRSPYASGSGVSRCLYVANYDIKEETDYSLEQTTVDAENLTLFNLSSDLDYDIKIGLVDEAIFIGEDANFRIDRSVISGFNPAVVLDSKVKINNENLGKIQFTRTYFNNCNGNIFIKNMPNNEDLESYYGSRAFDNVYSKAPDDETFIDAHNSRRPDFRLRINRIIASSDD